MREQHLVPYQPNVDRVYFNQARYLESWQWKIEVYPEC
jgi:hypothetical protein